MNTTWRFSALDSLFFREARPFDSIGGSELSSVFPPSPVTLAGAIRSAIGNHQKINWADYADSELEKQLGGSESLGSMRIKGVFLSLNTNDKWQRLYPVPAHLVKAGDKLLFLQVGEPAHCDLGKKVRLAVSAERGIKTLENHWLTQTAFEHILNGKLPDIKDLISEKDLFSRETRLGIGRNNQTRTNEQGLLYQTQHIRPKQALAIEVDVAGLDSSIYPPSGIVRLGGEGRGAAFKVEEANKLLPVCDHDKAAQGIKLILLTAVHIPQPNSDDCSKDRQSCYTPLPDFIKSEQNDNTVWQGEINGIKLTLHCAIIGKALREGGWDLQKKQPKPVRSLLPAGSVFYCTIDGDINTAIKTLHYQQIAQQNALDKSLGRGLLAACPWFLQNTHKE